MADTRQFTRAEVAAVDKKQTLFIIDNYVYDVSVFLDEHPGGHEVLQNVHGRDASEDFNDVGHSLDAKELMVKYRVGQLVQAERSEPRARAADWSSSPANTEEPAPLLSSWQVALLGGLLATLVYLYLY